MPWSHHGNAPQVTRSINSGVQVWATEGRADRFQKHSGRVALLHHHASNHKTLEWRAWVRRYPSQEPQPSCKFVGPVWLISWSLWWLLIIGWHLWTSSYMAPVWNTKYVWAWLRMRAFAQQRATRQVWWVAWSCGVPQGDVVDLWACFLYWGCSRFVPA